MQKPHKWKGKKQKCKTAGWKKLHKRGRKRICAVCLIVAEWCEKCRKAAL